MDYLNMHLLKSNLEALCILINCFYPTQQLNSLTVAARVWADKEGSNGDAAVCAAIKVSIKNA